MADYLNHIKIMVFEPDIFSNKTPIWNRIDNIDLFIDLCKNIPELYISEVSEVYYSGTFEINSSNYKIKSLNGKSILLKKWPLGIDKNKVENIQKLTNWLFVKNIPVPYVGLFIDDNVLFNYNESIWSFNLFNDGNYYSGENNELESVAKITGKLAQTLIDVPASLIPELGSQYLTEDDNFIIKEMLKSRNNWSNYFGIKNANLLNFHWNYIYQNWKSLYGKKFQLGPIVPCHFDMHPHNLIAKDGEIVAVLDFDSCKRIPAGISLAFNALKQCRQYVSNNKVSLNSGEVIDIYFENLLSEISFEDFSNYDFLNLSKIEVMRRICLIFRLNIIENNSEWNHVLSIQLSHLYESDKLFNKQ
ncbi:MAG: hypothetical protein ACI8ZX_000135 [Planctomycetota bacterium]|jgi:hypothetical protein